MNKKSLKFHIKSDDYFGTLATILSLWQQEKKYPEKDVEETIEDLLFLQKEYKIVKNKIIL